MSENKKKQKLILGQKSEPKEQMRFTDPGSKPDPGVEDALSRGETPYSKIPIKPPEGYSHFTEDLASEAYKEALDKLAEFTGERNIGQGLRGRYLSIIEQSYRLLTRITSLESRFTEQLEQLCENIVRKIYKIPENALQFNLKLQNTPTPVKQKQKKSEEQIEQEIEKTIDELVHERGKRRLLNAMTQGAAVNGTYLYKTVENELTEIFGNNNILGMYGAFVSTMLLNYWQFPDQMISATMGDDENEGKGAGKSRIDTTTNPPTINAEAMMFPFLIHETIKGVMEWMGIQRQKRGQERTDIKSYEAAMELEDKIQHEVWDIRLGPAVWNRLHKLFPNEIITNDAKKILQRQIYSTLANLPAKDFLIIMNEIIKETQDGKALIGAMYYELDAALDGNFISRSESLFIRKLNEIKNKKTQDELDQNIDDMLAELGITKID
jgi:hypothetical protein